MWCPYAPVKATGVQKGICCLHLGRQGRFSEGCDIWIGPWRIIRICACRTGGKNILERALLMAQSGGKANSEFKALRIVSLGWRLGGEKWRSVRWRTILRKQNVSHKSSDRWRIHHFSFKNYLLRYTCRFYIYLRWVLSLQLENSSFMLKALRL